MVAMTIEISQYNCMIRFEEELPNIGGKLSKHFQKKGNQRFMVGPGLNFNG